MLSQFSNLSQETILLFPFFLFFDRFSEHQVMFYLSKWYFL